MYLIRNLFESTQLSQSSELSGALAPQSIGFFTLFLLVTLFLGVLLIWFSQIVDALQAEFEKDVDKLIWVGLLLLFPLLGLPLYFYIGKQKKKNNHDA